MKQKIYYETSAFYDENGPLTKVFSEQDMALMFCTLAKSENYLKTVWGKWMKARDLCILASLRYMLLRPAEACKIKFKDIDFRSMTLLVRGKNNKEKKDRFVQIPSKFVEFYRYYLSFPRWMWKDSAYLFPSAENPCISPAHWKMIMREKILKPADLYEPAENGRIPRTRSYLLRVSGATELLDKNASPWDVAQTLGHSDLRTLQRYFFQTKKFKERQMFFLNKLS